MFDLIQCVTSSIVFATGCLTWAYGLWALIRWLATPKRRGMVETLHTDETLWEDCP